ncbi:MAG TPA: hypothetical protein VGH98_04685 [Gemmatimonadaceae bacterium]
MSLESRVAVEFRHFRRVAAAAARLSVVYTASVVALLTFLTLWTRELITDFDGMLEALAPVSLSLLCLIFASLFVFRRFGFQVVLFALAACWAYWPLRWIPADLLWGFVFWTILALPMYLVTVVAFPSHATSKRLRMLPLALISVWLGLVALVLFVLPSVYFLIDGAMEATFPAPPAMILHTARIVFGPLPFLIATEGCYRIGVGGHRLSQSERRPQLVGNR